MSITATLLAISLLAPPAHSEYVQDEGSSAHVSWVLTKAPLDVSEDDPFAVCVWGVVAFGRCHEPERVHLGYIANVTHSACATISLSGTGSANLLPDGRVRIKLTAADRLQHLGTFKSVFAPEDPEFGMALSLLESFPRCSGAFRSEPWLG